MSRVDVIKDLTIQQIDRSLEVGGVVVVVEFYGINNNNLKKAGTPKIPSNRSIEVKRSRSNPLLIQF